MDLSPHDDTLRILTRTHADPRQRHRADGAVCRGGMGWARRFRPTRGRMRAADVTETVAQLAHAWDTAVRGEAITITPTGHDVREAIEGETNRVYFAPWPAIDATWIHDRLAAITAQLNR